MKALGLLAIPLLARPRGAEGLQVPQDQRSTLDVETNIPPLKIFASTFNAGNTKIEENGDFKAQAAELMRGYEKYDVVIAGFQEVQLPPKFGRVLFGKDHNDVFHERFDSGYFCRQVSHYDTVVYVTTGKGSQWSIKHIQHERASCVSPGRPGSGCSIDNNQLFECGKAVNLLKFELTPNRGSNLTKKVHLCAMNTHMSFKGKAEQRAELIGAAMKEATNKAKCDVVVFVGDFNTRLHCYPDKSLETAYTEQAERGEATTALLDEVCSSRVIDDKVDMSTCAMNRIPSPSAAEDELREMLTPSPSAAEDEPRTPETTPKTTCGVASHVKKYGFREPEIPRFAPSYKLSIKRPGGKEAKKEKRLICDKNKEKVCYVVDGKAKHLVAWTDRVLYKVPETLHSKKVCATTDAYERRIVGWPFETDHAAVIAKLRITFGC